VMRPLRTAVITAALRRTTQRWVFGGGRSSLIATASGGAGSRGLVTGPRQNLGGQERWVARLGWLPAGRPTRRRRQLQLPQKAPAQLLTVSRFLARARLIAQPGQTARRKPLAPQADRVGPYPKFS